MQPSGVCSDHTWPPGDVVSLPNWPQMASEGLASMLTAATSCSLPTTSLLLFIWSQSDTHTHSDRQTRCQGHTQQAEEIEFFFCEWKQEHPETSHLPALSVWQVHKAPTHNRVNKKSWFIKPVQGSLQDPVSANSGGHCHRLKCKESANM